jgi:hypothetical protein
MDRNRAAEPEYDQRDEQPSARTLQQRSDAQSAHRVISSETTPTP